MTAFEPAYAMRDWGLSVVPCLYRRVVSRTVEEWVFRGRLEEGQCRLRFRLRGAKREGIAVLDTGFPEAMLGRQFAVESGIALLETGRVHLAGLGQKELHSVPEANATIELICDDGRAFGTTGLFAVDDSPAQIDLIIGTAIIGLGVFTLDGPSDTWEWRIDASRIEHFRREFGATGPPAQRT